MESITINKLDLLTALRANREGHREQFLKAQEGWKASIIEELERRMADAKRGKFVDARFYFREPEDHTLEYDRAIRMMEMDINSTIKMPEHDFAQYVMDDWGWKAEWTACNSSYINGVHNAL